MGTREVGVGWIRGTKFHSFGALCSGSFLSGWESRLIAMCTGLSAASFRATQAILPLQKITHLLLPLLPGRIVVVIIV